MLGYQANSRSVLAGGRSRTLGVMAVETDLGPRRCFGIESAARRRGMR